MKNKLLIASAIIILILLSVLIYIFFLSNNSIEPNIELGKGLDVEVQLSENSKSSTIDSSGGQISLSHNNNISSTLDITVDSLTIPQNISVTEIENLQGLEDFFIAGVDFEPSGTILQNGGVVSFSIPDNIDVSNLIGFRYSNNGQNLHSYPIIIDGNEVSMWIDGFSGAGIGDNSEGSPGEPSDTKSKFEQDLSNIDPEDIDSFKEFFTTWYNTSIKPSAQQSVNNDALINSAIREFLSWQGLTQFYGVSDEFLTQVSEAQQILGEAIDNAIEKAAIRCKQNSDLDEITTMQTLLQTAILNGFDEYMSKNFDTIREDTKECSTFKLTMDSIFTVSGESEVKATADIDVYFDLDSSTFMGSGTYTQEFYNLESFICTPEQATRPMSVEFMNITGTDPREVNVVLRVSENAQQFMNYTCTGSGITQQLNIPDPWISLFHSAHQDEYVGPGSNRDVGGLELTGQDYLLQQWNVTESNPYALKTYINTLSGEITENTDFTLVHTPQ